MKANTYLVRTRSKGARRTPVATAAVAATKRDAQGYGDAMSTKRSISSLRPRSGTLRTALKKLRDQFSRSDWRTVYKNVALDPFQTPHTPSFCQSPEITLATESACLMLRKCSGIPGFFGRRGDAKGDSERRPWRPLPWRGVGVSCTFDVK